MGRRLLFLVRIGTFALFVAIVVRFWLHFRDAPTTPLGHSTDPPSWPPITVPEPLAETPPWVLPTGDACPVTHPVKVKERSGIYHEPGMLNYERTAPDRCYRDGAAATADGFRAAKR